LGLALERAQPAAGLALDVECAVQVVLRSLELFLGAVATLSVLPESRRLLDQEPAVARLGVDDLLDPALADDRVHLATEVGVRERLEEAERLLAAIAERRERVEEEFAAHSRRREALSGRLFAARSAEERISMRLERAGEVAERSTAAAERFTRERDALQTEEREAPEGSPATDRVAALDEELVRVDAELAGAADHEVAGLVRERDAAAARREELESAVAARRGELDAAEQAAETARAARVDADREVEAARRHAAEAGAELAAVNQFLARAGTDADGRALAAELQVEAGCEAAVAAVLGPLLRAAVVNSINEGTTVLDGFGADGGSALVSSGGQRPFGDPIGVPPGRSAKPPVSGARHLLDLVQPAPRVAAAAERLLADAWLVPSLARLPGDFTGTAATAEGRVYVGSTGELRQAPAAGDKRLLEERSRRERLVGESEAAARDEAAALATAVAAARAVAAAYEDRDRAEGALRAAVRERDEAAEAVHRSEWLIERRRQAPAEGPAAVRRAEVAAELRAERRLAEQVELARAERRRRIAALGERARMEADTARHAERVAAALRSAAEAVALRREAAARDLAARDEHGESTAAELRTCAREEADLQRRLREAGELVTGAEVRAQQARDAATERTGDLRGVASALGHAEDSEHAAPLAEPLEAENRGELEARVERLARRREQLGPVNPLAKQEYDEAVEHVEELETQRADLESALTELEGLIRETDRRIRESFEETFEAAARNFEDVASHLFPGGRGRLRLVQAEQTPRRVLGGADGEEPEEGSDVTTATAEDEAPADDPGVEIEVTPAGKSTKRLSLMSGGEKSLVALAFLFAVFLARPCPFYILDEVEAALDDANIDRFLQLVRRYSDRAQFIVVTHQKRTMDAADCLYGVSMGGDGVSKVISRKLPPDDGEDRQRRFEPAADETEADAEVRAA
ncbi:MAG: chromosome segregation protein, partial [Thermoleophilaceae bacterium]|nr:chromosome segregation protein [Thermoleophilaceae bacterium]